VHEALVSYLQLPAGAGAGNYYDIDLGDFCQRFQLPPYMVTSVLKVLEQEGFMSFNEQVFMPARLKFISNKQVLYQFEEEQPAYEPLIKCLLRSYEGIFDVPVAIYEKQLAGWLKKDPAAIKKSLAVLHRFRIVHYEPQKDNPQLYLLQPRVKTADLSINEANYQKRKQQYEARLNHLVDYAQNSTDCRSVITGRYFGDEGIQACGVCDNCLAKKKLTLLPATFTQISTQVQQALAMGPLQPQDLLKALQNVKKENAWQVIEFLQAERKIYVDAQGLIALSR